MPTNAKTYIKLAPATSSAFPAERIVPHLPFICATVWCQNETLRELAKPEHVAKMKAGWEKSKARKKASRKSLALVETLGGLVVEADSHLRDGPLMCSL